MKNYLLWSLLLVIFIFSCKKNDIPPIEEEKPFVLHGSAESEDTATTTARMVYTDAGYHANADFTAGKVTVVWEVGEIIEFCFNQSGTIRKTTATVLTVNGNKCTFDVTVPAGINPGLPYDVYAVIGSFKGDPAQGTYINATTPQYVNFKFDIGSPKSNLTNTPIRNSIIQVARRVGVPGGTTSISFGFKQIGSLMGVAIKLGGSWAAWLNNLKLQATNQWVWDLSSASTRYDLFNGQMDPLGVKTNVMQIIGPTASLYQLSPGATGTCYQYFVPVSGVLPTNLTLTLHDDIYPANPSKTITTPPSIAVGMRYYINRTYNTGNGTFL